jgi:hypothetical protein
MTLNRLIESSSELAMSDWVARSALSDILKEDFRRLNEDRLYRKYGRAPWPTGPNGSVRMAGVSMASRKGT